MSIRKSKLPDEEQPNISPVIRKASLKKEKRLKKKTKKEKREVEQKEEDEEEMKGEKEVKVQKKKDERSGEVLIETKDKAVQTEGTQEVKWKLLEFWINKDLEVQRRREEELREEEEFFS
ncbi:uncharacterized protein LOC128636097 [Bombina bombina]|uniref:uncharacterized protein LOC128636097 n=1 Tax=Bombina bombina TaxID=8345 RepID=UPI00235A99C1|nr:uncharacterized protein LOC128636097 [Bombina bombina]